MAFVWLGVAAIVILAGKAIRSQPMLITGAVMMLMLTAIQ